MSEQGNARFERLETQFSLVLQTLDMIIEGTQADAAQANVQTIQAVMQQVDDNFSELPTEPAEAVDFSNMIPPAGMSLRASGEFVKVVSLLEDIATSFKTFVARDQARSLLKSLPSLDASEVKEFRDFPQFEDFKTSVHLLAMQGASFMPYLADTIKPSDPKWQIELHNRAYYLLNSKLGLQFRYLLDITNVLDQSELVDLTGGLVIVRAGVVWKKLLDNVATHRKALETA